MIEWKQRVWQTYKNSRWELIDISSIMKVESTCKISTSNRCYNFYLDWPLKIDEILTNNPHGISTSNRWRIDEDVSNGLLLFTFYLFLVTFCSLLVTFCSLLVTFCLLLVTFCSLLVTFRPLLIIFFTCYALLSLLFVRCST